ncbi:MAG: lysophospholipid acyltransferase family protein [Chloroflexota bacterium]
MVTNTPLTRYDHNRWETSRRILRFLLRTLGAGLLLRLGEVSGLENIPARGPAILYFNHISLVDPVVIIHLAPRNITPMAKVEVYNYPLIGVFPKWWGVIPVHREEFDRPAIRQAIEVLRAGEILLIAPEGTRSPQMQQAKDGMAYLACRMNVPLIPVGIDGTPGYPTLRGSRRWRAGGVTVRFGRPFRFRWGMAAQGNPPIWHANGTGAEKQPSKLLPDRELLRQMTDTAMVQLARLLPEHRRGIYREESLALQETIEMC